MKTTPIIVYPICEVCDKELRTIKDGILLRGVIYPTGPMDEDHNPKFECKPLVGRDFLDFERYPEAEYRNDCRVPKSAVCWSCFFKMTGAPVKA